MSEHEGWRVVAAGVLALGSMWMPSTVSEVGYSVTDFVVVADSDREMGTRGSHRVARWQTYVDQRLGELQEAKYDFTDLAVPSPRTIERARAIAGDTFGFYARSSIGCPIRRWGSPVRVASRRLGR